MVGVAGLLVDLIGAKPFLGQQTIAHRIAEGIDMPRRLPNLRVHDDRRLEAGDIFASAGHRVPPELFDVAFEFRAERAVIPETVDATVDFRRLENESAPFAQ